MSVKKMKFVSIAMLCISFLLLFAGWLKLGGISSNVREMMISGLNSEYTEIISESSMDKEAVKLLRTVKDLQISPVEGATISKNALTLLNDERALGIEAAKKLRLLAIVYLILFVLTVLGAILALVEMIKGRSFSGGIPVFLICQLLMFILVVVLSIFVTNMMRSGAGLMGSELGSLLEYSDVDYTRIGLKLTAAPFLAVLFAVPLGYYMQILNRTSFGQKVSSTIGSIGSNVAGTAMDVASKAKESDGLLFTKSDWTCPSCGKTVGKEMSFCPYCGAEKPAEPEPRFCHKCGSKLQEGVLFCGKCGTPVLETDTNNVPEPVLQPKKDVAMEAEKSRKTEPEATIVMNPSVKPERESGISEDQSRESDLAEEEIPKPEQKQKPKMIGLTISSADAENGVKKTIKLPGGEIKKVMIPAGVTDGKKMKVHGKDQLFILRVKVKD